MELNVKMLKSLQGLVLLDVDNNLTCLYSFDSMLREVSDEKLLIFVVAFHSKRLKPKLFDELRSRRWISFVTSNTVVNNAADVALTFVAEELNREDMVPRNIPFFVVTCGAFGCELQSIISRTRKCELLRPNLISVAIHVMFAICQIKSNFTFFPEPISSLFQIISSNNKKDSCLTNFIRQIIELMPHEDTSCVTNTLLEWQVRNESTLSLGMSQIFL